MLHLTELIMAKTTYNLHLKGHVGGWDFDSDYVDYVLNKNTDKEVSVLIDSLGGQFNTALSISSAFRRHGNVHVHFVGMNASAATIASMGAKRITMDKSAVYLVHQCSQSFFEWGSLNATDMQNLIDNLEKQKADLNKFDATVAEMYAARCKKKPAELLELMKVGGWLTAQEALSWGFVDELTEYDDETAPVMTEAIAADSTAHGIPLPNLQTDKQEEINAFRRFIQSCAAVFHFQDKTHINTSPSITSTIMKKTYKNICKTLACEALEAEDDKTTLTTQQLETIEADIEAKEKSIGDLTSEVDRLTKANKDLDAKVKSLPADTTSNVVDDKKNDPSAEKTEIEKFYDTTNSAQALFDSLP